MKFQSFAVFASLIIIGALRSASAAAPTVVASVSANSGKSGVNITPITRNESASKIALQLAKEGKALLPIVISEKASASTKALAADLKKFLDMMSGGEFEIKTGDGTSGIVLGNRDEFPVPALDKALAIVNGFDGKEAYAIRTRENKVLLLGATDAGASHAAYRFLDELGCRWFFPAKEWEVIPKTPDLKFAREITDRPNFLSRRIWAAWGLHDGKGPDGRTAGGDSGAWAQHNHMGESFASGVGHANGAIIAAKAEEFKAHPEYYALIGDKRSGPQFDYSNPGLRKLIADYAIEYFTKNPRADMVAIGPADGGGASTGAQSDAYANASDSVFKMANEVAKSVQKAFPGQNKLLGIYAYNWHSDPPPFELEPNIYIQLTTAFNAGALNLDQLLVEWPKKAKNLGFRDYYSVYKWDFDRWPGGRIAYKSYAIDMIRTFEKANVRSGAYATSISAESGFNFGPNGRGYYLASQLMWNPQLDADTILDDFYSKAFGKGAAAMKRYYDQADNTKFMSPGIIGLLFKNVNEASEATKNDPAIQARIEQIKQYLIFEYLQRLNSVETDAARRAARNAQIIAFEYRTRWSYMMHWYAMTRNGTKLDLTKATELKYEEPVTTAETEALFQEGLKYFPELRAPVEVKFSDVLIPADLSAQTAAGLVPSAKPGENFVSANYRSYSRKFAFWSRKGEPIKFKIHAGTMYGGLKHSYVFQTVDGKELAAGKPAGNTDVDVEVKVPKAGLYYLIYSDGGSNIYSIETAPDVIFSVPLDTAGGSGTIYGASPNLFFYVPKGTKNIELYSVWHGRGRTVQIFDPENKLVKDLGGAPDYFTLPVPPGQDGKVWKVAGLADWGFSILYFFNCPDVLSPNPAQMLLPQDIIAKDGLKAIK